MLEKAKNDFAAMSVQVNSGLVWEPTFNGDFSSLLAMADKKMYEQKSAQKLSS